MEHIVFMYSCVTATKLCGGCHDSHAKHSGAKDLMAESFKDSCVWGRCLLTAYSACNYKVSKPFFQTLPPKNVGQLADEIPEERRISSITLLRLDGRKKNKRAHSKLWLVGQVWCVEEEPDLNKAPLCKLPFLRCKVLTSCMVHFVVSFSSWEWGNLQIRYQDRQIYVRTASLPLLSIPRWSSHWHYLQMLLSHNKLYNWCISVMHTHKCMMRDINDRKLLNLGCFFFSPV